MSSSVESKSRSSATLWQPEVLLVGHAKIADDLTKMVRLAGSKLKIQLDPLIQKNVRSLCFGRDSRIMLSDGSYLVPYCISLPDWKLEMTFKAMLPSTAAHFVKNMEGCYGTGFTTEFASKALHFAKENDIPCKEGKSVIEGGNCHLYSSSDGIPKAIIGELSLLLTVIGLDEQGYFSSPLMQQKLQSLQSRLSAPSQESLRMARNLHLLNKFEPIFSWVVKNQKLIEEWTEMPSCEMGSQSKTFSNPLFDNGQLRGMLTSINPTGEDVYDLFLEPLSYEDSSNPQFLKWGWEWEAKLSLARELIAKELRVAPEDVIFIPQAEFHIDMDLFVEPATQTVYLHDEALSREFLCNNSFYGRDSFLAVADERLAAYGPAYAAMESSLNEGGCRVVKVAGVFSSVGCKVNFMNGCFIPSNGGTIFVTNGSAHYTALENCFKDQLLQKQPDVEVSFLNSSTIDNILTLSSGGLHCITWPMGNPCLENRVSVISPSEEAQ